MKTIKVDKVILYHMDRVDPDGNLYRFYVYKGMASEIEYFCTEEAGNMTIPIGEGKYLKIVYENKAFMPYRPIKETQDLPINAKYIPLLTRIFGENILAEIGGGKIFITTGKYAVNFWCWGK